MTKVDLIPIGRCCVQDRSGIRGDSAEGVALPFVGLEHIAAHSGRISISHDSGGKSVGTNFLFDERHVLYGKLRPYLNKVALPDFSGRCSTELIPLLPCEGVDREYLAFALRSPRVVSFATKHSAGSRMPRAKLKNLFQLKIPLPPLSEQRRIVARLRQELQDCDEIRRVSESQFENARAFPALLLRDIFRQVNHFPMVVLSDLCDILRGVAFSANQSHNFPFAGSVACATTKSVQEEVDWESCRHIPAGVVKNHARILQVGDILISIANSKELVGKISVVRAIPFRATFGAFVAVLRSNKGVLPEFLASYLRAPQVKRYFYIHSSNTTNISNLNMRRVMAMPVALPSLAEQRRLVDYSRAQLKNGTDISVAAERRLESARALPQAFLRRAFS